MRPDSSKVHDSGSGRYTIGRVHCGASATLHIGSKDNLSRFLLGVNFNVTLHT